MNGFHFRTEQFDLQTFDFFVPCFFLLLKFNEPGFFFNQIALNNFLLLRTNRKFSLVFTSFAFIFFELVVKSSNIFVFYSYFFIQLEYLKLQISGTIFISLLLDQNFLLLLRQYFYISLKFFNVSFQTIYFLF